LILSGIDKNKLSQIKMFLSEIASSGRLLYKG